MGEWLADRDVDILTLQEVRASTDDLEGLLGPEWNVLHDAATAKGRAGVAIASRGAARHPPRRARRRRLRQRRPLARGRLRRRRHDRHGRQHLRALGRGRHPEAGREVEVPRRDEPSGCPSSPRTPSSPSSSGDLNVGHRELDIKNWKGNVKRAGFLPRERAYFDRFFGPEGEPVETADGDGGTGLGWVDVGRRLAGEVEGPYTWWSWRGQAFDNDTGWRIDYHVATPGPRRARRRPRRRPGRLLRQALVRPRARRRRLRI